MTLLRKPFLFLAPAAILLAALALVTNVLPFRQILAQREAIAAAQSRLDDLMAANQGLEARLEALDTPIEVERIAREQLGYVRPGETAYVVMEPERPTPTTVSPPPTEEAPRSWLSRVWDFVTGRDLTSSR